MEYCLVEAKSFGKIYSGFSTLGLEEAIMNLKWNNNIKQSQKIYVRIMDESSVLKRYISKLCDIEEEFIKN